MPDQPEPNGWELMRGLKDLREAVDKLSAGVVSQALFATIVERVTALEREQAEQRRTKAQQWFAIGMALFGVVCTIVAGVIVFNVTRVGG